MTATSERTTEFYSVGAGHTKRDRQLVEVPRRFERPLQPQLLEINVNKSLHFWGLRSHNPAPLFGIYIERTQLSMAVHDFRVCARGATYSWKDGASTLQYGYRELVPSDFGGSAAGDASRGRGNMSA